LSRQSGATASGIKVNTPKMSWSSGRVMIGEGELKRWNGEIEHCLPSLAGKHVTVLPVVNERLEELGLDALRVNVTRKVRKGAQEDGDEAASLLLHHLAVLIAFAKCS
jgi:hypothetical protein